MDSLFTGGVILGRKFLAFALSLVILCALVFELYPRSSQEIDLSTGAGISKMLRYENAQVYLFGETHRCTEYQQFRNVLFKYLVKEKGVRVLVEEAGYATTFLENETVQGRLSFSDWLDRCTSSKEDYELYQWIADWNSGREDADKISIIGIDITDNIGNMQMLCQYLLKTCNFTGADVQTQRLLTAIRKQNPFSSLQLQTFQDEFLPQLIELYQTKPEQLENVLEHRQCIWSVPFWVGRKHWNSRNSAEKRNNWVIRMMCTGRIACMRILCGSIRRDRTQNIMESLVQHTF